MIKCLIAADGSIKNVEVLKGIGSGCDEEALRIVNLMPKWQPALKNGKPVSLYYNFPISFKPIGEVHIIRASRNPEKTIVAGSSSTDSLINNSDIFYHVEEFPEFPGGMKQLVKFIGKTLRYPAFARRNRIQGKVISDFVITEDGSVSDIKVSQGIDSDLDEEALRVIRLMPKWNPGKRDGQPVRVHYTFPIMFKL
ncbi:TonB family C-terminal domain-containing protein [Solitalea koreensis]|uniref:TonB family C-terminal domain-containing protein n=2 Tax=Solitalea koreensis TaxID=543615 RepID=A0A521DI98_9SPHI|nr:TonB family C-terminal domain-containing protein [Solitalea koreensis]